MSLAVDDASATGATLLSLSRERIEKGSKSFALAARLFDTDTRASAYMLYAWCRHCDDVVDDQILGHRPSGADPVANLDTIERRVFELETQTRLALAGKAVNDPVFEALAMVVARHQIPHHHAFELLEGFRMDAQGRAYHTLDDTLTYCYHVAGVVGVMMGYVMGVRQPSVLDRACDLGLAFQLTNIARDVVPDAQAGRVYLPADWLADAGLRHSSPAQDLADPRSKTALANVTARLLDAAEPYYASASAGMAHLPLRSAWAVGAARTVYRDIGLRVRHLGANAWDGRARTGRARKVLGIGRGLAAAIASRQAGRESNQPERTGLWVRPQHRASHNCHP